MTDHASVHELAKWTVRLQKNVHVNLPTCIFGEYHCEFRSCGSVFKFVSIASLNVKILSPRMRKPTISILYFRPGPTQTGLYSYRSELIPVAKAKALMSWKVTAQLICAFVFAYADCLFSDASIQWLDSHFGTE